MIEAMFSRLPAEWQVYDFRVAGGVVEFGLRLPNNLVLPIDHKWPAVDLLDRLAASDDPKEQAILQRQVNAQSAAKRWKSGNTSTLSGLTGLASLRS